MACTVPELLYSCTLPSLASCAVTRLATSRPGGTLRLDEFGGLPEGNTVRKVAADGWVAVRFRTTPDTCVAGTPPWPVIWTFRDVLGCSAPPPFCVLVSRIRVGGSEWKPVPDGVSVSVAVLVRLLALSEAVIVS